MQTNNVSATFKWHDAAKELPTRWTPCLVLIENKDACVDNKPLAIVHAVLTYADGWFVGQSDQRYEGCPIKWVSLQEIEGTYINWI